MYSMTGFTKINLFWQIYVHIIRILANDIFGLWDLKIDFKQGRLSVFTKPTSGFVLDSYGNSFKAES